MGEEYPTPHFSRISMGVLCTEEILIILHQFNSSDKGGGSPGGSICTKKWRKEGRRNKFVGGAGLILVLGFGPILPLIPLLLPLPVPICCNQELAINSEMVLM